LAVLKPRWLACLVLAVVLSLAAEAPAEETQLSELQVKAAFLYNFATFVEWPAAALEGRTSFTIGLVGPDPFRGLLNQLEGRPANGHPIDVKRFKSGDDPRAYHLLFVADSYDPQVAELLAGLADAPVLTVGESWRFLRAGGIVRLFVDDSKVRFEIDVDRAARAGLRISSKVLSLARLAGRERRSEE
jgi:hypothetical protein